MLSRRSAKREADKFLNNRKSYIRANDALLPSPPKPRRVEETNVHAQRELHGSVPEEADAARHFSEDAVPTTLRARYQLLLH